MHLAWMVRQIQMIVEGVRTAQVYNRNEANRINEGWMLHAWKHQPESQTCVIAVICMGDLGSLNNRVIHPGRYNRANATQSKPVHRSLRNHLADWVGRHG